MLAARSLFLALLLTTHAFAGPTEQRYEEAAAAMTRAIAAYRTGEHVAFLNAMQLACELRTDHPTYLTYLAAAQALNGDAQATARTLSQLASWGLVVDAEEQTEFDAVRDDEAVQAAFAALRHNQQARGTVMTRLTLSAAGGLYEGLTEDPKTERLYLSDLHHARILQIDKAGTTRVFASSPAKGFGFGGLCIDAARRLLWVASPAMPEVEGFEEAWSGQSQLLAFNLEDGSLVQRVALPLAVDAAHTVVDLFVAPDGTVYAPDSASPVIWRVTPDADVAELFATIDRPGSRHSLQGAALSPNGEWLLVSDYSTGLHRIHLQDQRIEFLNTPTDHIGTAIGIDGIAVINHTLLAVQNGVSPARLLRIQLSPTGLPLDATVAASGLPEVDDPTLVTASADGILAIGRAGWPFFGPRARTDSPERIVLVVRVLTPP